MDDEKFEKFLELKDKLEADGFVMMKVNSKEELEYLLRAFASGDPAKFLADEIMKHTFIELAKYSNNNIELVRQLWKKMGQKESAEYLVTRVGLFIHNYLGKMAKKEVPLDEGTADETLHEYITEIINKKLAE